MSDSPERAALLNAILDAPMDDLPRLVFADWLEEHGEVEQAGFIRIQCQRAELEKEGVRCNCDSERGRRYDRQPRRLSYRCRGPLCKLIRLENKFSYRLMSHWNEKGLAAARTEWRRNDQAAWREWDAAGRNAITPDSTYEDRWMLEDDTVIYRRGFIDELHLPVRDFLAHSATLFAGLPITTVLLFGLEPTANPYGGDTVAWSYIGEHDPPFELYTLLTESTTPPDLIEYETANDALVAISRAAVNFGRTSAGLKPLFWQDEDEGAED